MEDGRYRTLDEAPQPAVFWPARAIYNSTMTILVRSALPQPETTALLRQVVRTTEPRAVLFCEGTIGAAIAFAFLPAQAASVVLGVFGVLAVATALIGVHGLAASSVRASPSDAAVLDRDGRDDGAGRPGRRVGSRAARVEAGSGRDAAGGIEHFPLACRASRQPDCERADGGSLKNGAKGSDRRLGLGDPA